MFNLGSQELLIIGAVVLVLFGGSKIPELMKGLGSGVREFKNAVNSPDSPSESPKEPDTEQSDAKNR